MISSFNSLSVSNYISPNGVFWPYYRTTLNPTLESAIAPKIEENPKELKINIKKHQIKFNFNL